MQQRGNHALPLYCNGTLKPAFPTIAKVHALAAQWGYGDSDVMRAVEVRTSCLITALARYLSLRHSCLG